MIGNTNIHIGGLAQDCSQSSAKLELLQSSTKPCLLMPNNSANMAVIIETSQAIWF